MPGVLDYVGLHRVDNLDTLDACRRWASQQRPVPLFADTESNGLNPHQDKHRMTQLGDLNHGWAFPPEWMGAAHELLQRYAGPVGFHNSPYDQRVLAVHHGFQTDWAKTEDTMLLAHISDSIRLAGLKPRAAQEIDPNAARYQDTLATGMKARHWTWETTPDTWEPYWQYAAMDPVLAAHLWWKFNGQRSAYHEAYDLERATARICTNMMLTGMRIDRPYIEARISEITAYTSQAYRWLHDQFGINNPASAQQVVRAMGEWGIPVDVYTEKGNPSLSKETLGYYSLAYPDYAALFDSIRWCRKANSLVNNYLAKFLAMATGDILHYNIHSCRARTSRMSISEPAMQTFDRDIPFVRGSIIPREGCVLISIDADQIEARLTAHFSADPRMIADFAYADANHLKFFIEMASHIYGERITKRDPRYTWTKNATYGQIYGAGLPKTAATAGVPIEVMRPAYEGLSMMYPNVERLMKFLISTGGDSRPRVQLIDGRMMYANRGKEYALLNTLIQGCAAIILKRGIINIDAAGMGEFLRLPVHDEILLEVPAAYAADVLREVERILTDNTSFRVPITWSGNILEERWVKA